MTVVEHSYINYDLQLAFDMSAGAISLTIKSCKIFVSILWISASYVFSFHAPGNPSSIRSNSAEHTDNESWFLEIRIHAFLA
jgi:hypothetical protein